MSDVTQRDLTALAERLESAIRYESGLLRSDVRDQNDRLTVNERNTAALDKQVSVLRHDLENHLGAHESFLALVSRGSGGSRAQKDTAGQPSKAFIAGAIAAIIALSGVANICLQLLTELVKRMK